MSDKIPQFLEQIKTEYISATAHSFIVAGNIFDFIDNSGHPETPVEALNSFIDDGVAKRSKEIGVDRGLQNKNNKNSVHKAIATYDISKGLRFASLTSHSAWVDIMTKFYSAAEIENWRDDWQNPVSPDAFFWVISKWHHASKSIHQENLDSLAMGKVATRTELLLYIVFPNADALFPNGQISQLSGDRMAIVTMRNWAKDEVLGKRNIFIMLSRHITEINESLRGASSGIVSINIPKPTFNDRKEWLNNYDTHVRAMATSKGGFLKVGNNDKISQIDYAEGFDEHQFAIQSAGMSRKQLKDVILKSWKDNTPIDFQQVRERKQKAIDDEYEGIVDFFEPEYGFEEIGGHEHVKDYFKRKVIGPLKAGDAKRCSSGVLLLGPPGTGKCFAPGTKVIMFDGSIQKVENVKVGQLLMGPDSKPRTVLSLGHGFDNMFTVTPVKGESYTVNQPHILSLKESGKEVVTNISVEDYLNKGSYFKSRMKGYRSFAVDFPEKDVSLDPYFLGLWLGDGDNRRQRITSFDDVIVNFLRDHSKELEMNFSTYSQLGKCPSYTIINQKGKPNKILDFLRAYNLLQNKHVPFEYKTNSKAIRLKLLAGLLDSDGSYDRKGKVFDFINKSSQVSMDVAFVARSLGLAAYVTRCNKTCGNNGVEGEYYRVCISGDLNIIPCLLERKKPLLRNQIKDVLKTGITVAPAGFGEYFGFEIDGDHLFLLEDFTVVHNTALSKALAKEAQMNFMIGNLGKLFGGIVGETEQKTRKFFEAVESAAPVIVFLDEIDSVLSSGRTSTGDSGVAARVFNSVMTFLSDDSRKGKVVIVAASNRPDLLDSALIRSGRFDAKIPCLPPFKGDNVGRSSILASLLLKHNVKFAANMKETAKDSKTGLGSLLHDKERIWTGAEIEVVIKEAIDNAYYAGRKNKDGTSDLKIHLDDWNKAMEDILPNTEEVERMTALGLLYADSLAYIPPEWKEQLEINHSLEPN